MVEDDKEVKEDQELKRPVCFGEYYSGSSFCRIKCGHANECVNKTKEKLIKKIQKANKV